jgi:hypothetical protein
MKNRAFFMRTNPAMGQKAFACIVRFTSHKEDINKRFVGPEIQNMEAGLRHELFSLAWTL